MPILTQKIILYVYTSHIFERLTISHLRRFQNEIHYDIKTMSLRNDWYIWHDIRGTSYFNTL